ncbi:MAG: uracil phosphoribosyltransferase [candidate division KSB1 bacterium]|nr:uracil phosphoribosyltransferase [candidate division KSB1 bacterium]MDZ7302953.1 uracil phosphoribosyltransferase [candidate division KSB1 bacterium]MDZ7312229.1 uracil phosphoribosyltransferase [candidate division KSB1 bacterium]
MNNLIIIQHPLIQHKLTYLRDKRTDHMQFRLLVKELTSFMLYEVMADYPLKEIEIETPLMPTTAKVLAREISLVLILRAGLGMVDGLLQLVPEARVGHIGLYRNEETLEPVQYYAKLPANIAETEVIIVDPMLATGGSAATAAGIVKKNGAKNIKFVCIVAAPEGVSKLSQTHPDVAIYTAALDLRLNDYGYILPGLGDAGDRLFGTK